MSLILAGARRKILPQSKKGFKVQTLFMNGEAGGVYDPSDLTAEKVAWRRNLLTWSEDFTNAAWTKTNSSITSNAGTSWDGTATASKLVNNTANAVHHLRLDTPSYPTVRPSVPYVMSIYAKAAELSWIYLLSLGRSPSDGASESSAWFNLANGTVGFQNRCTASIESVGNGWYRCSILTTTAGLSASSQREMRIGLATGDTVQSYLGDGTSGVLIDSAQMETFSLTAYQRITDFTSDFLAAFPTHGLYQDSAGTTPVTALGQPVGLVYDASRGSTLGPELLADPSFDNAGAWEKSAGVTISGGQAVWNTAGASEYVRQPSIIAANVYYEFTIVCSSYTSGSVVVGIGAGGSNLTNFPVSAVGTVRFRANTGAFSGRAWLITPVGGAQLTIDSFSVREVPGVHAIQATSSSRPLLDGRVNLLERPEEFANAVWTNVGPITITSNAVTAPDGTVTADTFAGGSYVQEAFNVTAGAAYIGSVFVRVSAATTGYISFGSGALWGGANPQCSFDLTAGTATGSGGATAATIQAVGGGWFRVFVAATATASGASGLRISTNVSVWGADARLAADAAYPYQRVAAATDYADVGVPRSFAFDGFDDSLYTASNMNLSGTDKVTVLAGVRKNADATAVIAELSADKNSNNGVFFLNTEAAPRWYWESKGTIAAGTNSGGTTTFPAPATSVVCGLGNISGDSSVLRVNGAQLGSNTGDQGTGNYGSHVLFIGRRNNASLPFHGKAYQLIVRGALTDAATLAGRAVRR